jgi:hypothetical protein
VTLSNLSVTVRWNDGVVESRVLHVGDEVWLGEAPCSEVCFPGPSLRVRRINGRLQVQGRWIDPGHPLKMCRDQLEVVLEAVPSAGTPQEWSTAWLPDLRLLVASAAIVLLGAWWEAVGSFVDRHPETVAQVFGWSTSVEASGPSTLPASLSPEQQPSTRPAPEEAPADDSWYRDVRFQIDPNGDGQPTE